MLPLELLSSLWLHEPDSAILARAQAEHGLPVADLTELRVAYTDLFLLNVYPYGTVFTDPSGELNGTTARQIAAQFQAHSYAPPELSATGAPDHLGLCLGFLAHNSLTRVTCHVSRITFGSQTTEFLFELLSWAPACCLAVEREPSAHSFYRALAARTRERLFREAERTQISRPPGADSIPQTASVGGLPSAVIPDDLSSEDEIRLRDVLQFLLAPARCGMFLSRSRLGVWGRGLGLRLPFSSRYDVAESLFAAAGQSGQVEALLDRLAEEADAWERAYQTWAKAYPTWAGFSAQWTSRTRAARRRLEEMRGIWNARAAVLGGDSPPGAS